MQKISCGHVAQNNLAVQSCFNTSLCGSSQRTSQHFSKTNSRINIKHLCVAPSLRFHLKATVYHLFLSVIFEEAVEISAYCTSTRCLVWWCCPWYIALPGVTLCLFALLIFFPFRLFISSPGLIGEFTPRGGKRFTSEWVKISSQLKQEQRTLSSLQNVCWNIKGALNVLFPINKSSLNLETQVWEVETTTTQKHCI